MASPGTLANLIPPDESGIMRRFEEIERTLREMPGAIMATIGPAIATLTAAVADITELIGQQVKIQSITNAATGWGLPGTEQVLVSQTAAVPTGFTKASLFVTTVLSVLGYTGSGGSYVRARSGVDSSYGTQSTAYLYDTDAITISAASTADLVGLADGGTITVNGYGVALSGAKPAVASNTAVVNALILWSR